MKMQSFIYFFMIFAMSLATDVTIYTASDFLTKDLTNTTTEHKPVSHFSFEYHPTDRLRMRIYFINKPSTVTAIRAIYNLDNKTEDSLLLVESVSGEEYFWITYGLNYTKVKISLTLYTSHSSCSSVTVAEGRVSSSRDEITNKTSRRDLICLKPKPCVLLVNLDHECEDTLVAERGMKTTTARMVTDFKNLNNNTFIVPISSHTNLEATTNQTTGNNASAKSTNNTFIIIGSLSGVSLILLAIIASWKRCWIKPSPQGTPDLPTNQNFQPFYPNMLFRRECDLEIAELEQHDYEEINPRDIQDQHDYEEINPQVPEGS